MLHSPLRVRAYQPTTSLTSENSGERSSDQFRNEVWSAWRVTQLKFYNYLIIIGRYLINYGNK